MKQTRLLTWGLVVLLGSCAAISCSSSDSTLPLLQKTGDDPKANAITCEELVTKTSFPYKTGCFAEGLVCPLTLASVCEAGTPVALCGSVYWSLSCQMPDAGSDASEELDGSSDAGNTDSPSDSSASVDAVEN